MNIILGYRKMLGYTQSDMADKLGISKQSYYRKENRLVPYSDKEKLIIKEMLIPHFPNITIDDIFFADRCHKVESR